MASQAFHHFAPVPKLSHSSFHLPVFATHLILKAKQWQTEKCLLSTNKLLQRVCRILAACSLFQLSTRSTSHILVSGNVTNQRSVKQLRLVSQILWHLSWNAVKSVFSGLSLHQGPVSGHGQPHQKNSVLQPPSEGRRKNNSLYLTHLRLHHLTRKETELRWKITTALLVKDRQQCQPIILKLRWEGQQRLTWKQTPGLLVSSVAASPQGKHLLSICRRMMKLV